MKRISVMLLLAGLTVSTAGCSKGTPSPPAPAATVRATTTHEQNEEAVEDDARAIERHAQEAKRTIDAITAEAEDALRRTHQNLKTEAKQRLQSAGKKRLSELSESELEAAEDAKDRAEDLAGEVERRIESRQADRRPYTRDRPSTVDEVTEDRDSSR